MKGNGKIFCLSCQQVPLNSFDIRKFKFSAQVLGMHCV